MSYSYEWRQQETEDAIEEQRRENRERFWRERAEAAEYWRRVAAGEIDPDQESDDGECETEDPRADRCSVSGVPGHSRRSQYCPGDETSSVASDGGVRSTDRDSGRGVDGLRTDGDMPAEGGGDQ